MKNNILGVAKSAPISLNLKYLNRHTFIGGATGSGKTVTIMKMVEILHQNEVPCIVFDAKGDLSSLLEVYDNSTLLDFYGIQGSKIDISIRDFGSDALAQLLNLTIAQHETLNVLFKYAKENDHPLNTVHDLLILLNIFDSLIQKEDQNFIHDFGRITNATITTFKRKLTSIERYHAQYIFEETSFKPLDLVESFGISVIDVKKLTEHYASYSGVLVHMLNELYNNLPEVGDLDKPKMSIFIDESHLLFRNLSTKQIGEIERVILLIRSKGVSINFISQDFKIIPKSIFQQLGTKIQHRTEKADDYTKDIEQDKDMTVLEQLKPGQAIAFLFDEKGQKEKLNLQISMPIKKHPKEVSQYKRNLYSTFSNFEQLEKSFKVEKVETNTQEITSDTMPQMQHYNIEKPSTAFYVKMITMVVIFSYILIELLF